MVLIRLHYGPVETNGVIKHEIQKVMGLTAGLLQRGYDVHVIPSRFLNRLVIEIMGYEIHRRNVKYLQFNTLLDYDSLCNQIIVELKDTIQKFFPHYTESCYPRLSRIPQCVLRQSQM